MKKLVGSLLAITLMATLSMGALEKPATPDVDIETLRIEKMVDAAKNKSGATLEDLKATLTQLKEKAKAKTAEELQKLNRLMTDLEAAIKSHVNK